MIDWKVVFLCGFNLHIPDQCYFTSHLYFLLSGFKCFVHFPCGITVFTPDSPLQMKCSPGLLLVSFSCNDPASVFPSDHFLF